MNMEDVVELEAPLATRAGAEPRVLPPGRAAETGREVGQIELNAGLCRVFLVDGVLPTHSVGRGGNRVRLTYLPGEIGHFEFAGHRYALVPAAPNSTEIGSTRANLREVLTSRELQVVQLVCLGYLTKQVADRLQISEFTVRSYLKNVYAKLGVRSRAALVCRYLQEFKADD